MREANRQEAPADAYERFIKAQAQSRLGRTVPPVNLSGWDDRLARIKRGLLRSLGRMPETPCSLDPEVLGTLARDGYAIERLTFQSRPGVRVTANLYRPDPSRERAPGVISVHGHWSRARMDLHVQPRCIGLAKLGYVVLCLDAFGAGERAIEPGPATYHGGLVGASLWPVGTPLIGLQVYDNRRAVDYLISRSEVDPTKLAITGASGGGNQTLYAGATDDRLAAVIPVCGIGTYESYLSTACCVCELNVAGATYATTGDLLAMVAPRALLVVSATRDARQFSVGEAAKSVSYARERYRLLGQPEKIRHTSVESGHDYNVAMREAMYGWLEKWLRGRGDAAPLREPTVSLEEIDALRCFADNKSRPRTIVTIPEWAFREGKARLATLGKVPDHIDRWLADAERMRTALRDQVLGGFPGRIALQEKWIDAGHQSMVTIQSEPGIRLHGIFERPARGARGTTVLISGGSGGSADDAAAEQSTLDGTKRKWHEAGFATLTASVRELPKLPAITGVADHTAAEWALWVGRPLLAQWVWDTIRWLDFLDLARETHPGKSRESVAGSRPFFLTGRGGMGLSALLAAALDDRVRGVFCEGALVSFVSETAQPWTGIPMGVILPNVLEVGDIGHLAALVAPRPMIISGAIDTNGRRASDERTRSAFGFCRGVYRLSGVADRLKLSQAADPRDLISWL